MRKALLFLVFVFLVTVSAIGQICNPQASNTCEGAPVLCGLNELNGYSCRNPPPPNTAGPTPLCPGGGVPNNMSWWAFVAGSNTTSLQISATNCTIVGGQQGVQAGIWTDCSFTTPVFCQPGCWVGQQVLTGATVPCQTYYVFIDGCAGSECDYTVQVLQGANPPSLTGPPMINGPNMGCPGQSICFQAIVSGQCQPDYTWTVDGVESPETGDQLCEIFPTEGTFEICVSARVGNANTICDESPPTCTEVVIMKLPEEDRDPETICYEDRFGLFFTECATPVQPVPGVQRICCEAVKPNGCLFDVCKEYKIREQPIEGYEEVVLCQEEPFQLANGQIVSECGNYVAYVPKGGPVGCDTTIVYDVAIIEPMVDLLPPTCIGGQVCIQAITLPACPLVLPNFNTTWIDRLSGAILAQNTDFLCVDEPGEYCYLVQSEYNGLLCPPVQYCIPVPDLRPAAPPINGDSVLCIREGTYSIEELPNQRFLNIEWSVSAGTITSGLFTKEITVDFNNAGGSFALVCVEVVTECGRSLPGCDTVWFQEPPMPDAGPDALICDSLTYNMMAVPSVSGGIWSIDTMLYDATFSDRMDPNARITVDTPGVYEFYWTEETNGCIISDTVVLIFNETPEALMYSDTCDLNTNNHYYFNFVIEKGTPPYNLVSGPGTINENNGVWTFDSDQMANGSMWTVTVQDSFGCEFSLSGQKQCDCFNGPGDMADEEIEICGPNCAQSTLLDAGIQDANDTAEYILHTQNGTVLGTILERNKTGEFCFDAANMTYNTTYYISWVIGNDDGTGSVDITDICLQVADGQPVVWYEQPVADAGSDDEICGLSIDLLANPSVGVGTWVYRGSENVMFSEPNTAGPTVTVENYGTYVFTWIEDNNGCIDSASVTINFNESPALRSAESICDFITFQYVVSFEIVGGTPPYMLDPSSLGTGTITNNGMEYLFESDPLNSLDSFSFVIVDANGCVSNAISGRQNCDCGDRRPGTMQQDTLIACIDGTVTGMTNGDEVVVPGEDDFAFILHYGDRTTLINPIDTNRTGTFGFRPDRGMMTGEVYYISFVVANPRGNPSWPDLNDPCLRVAPGQPVIFYDYPELDAGDDTQFCDLTGLLSAVADMGTSTWTLISGPGMALIETPGSPSSVVNVTELGTYVFEYTEDFNGCVSSDQVTLTFVGSPTFVMGSEMIECDDVGENFRVTWTAQGGQQSTYDFVLVLNGTDTLRGTNAGSTSGASFTSVFMPNGTNYEILVNDANDCNTDRVTGTFICDCISMVGNLNLDPIDVCADEVAVSSYDLAHILDPNDTYEYILHDGNMSNIGTILDRNKTGEFSFLPGMVYGQTYYVTVVAGNDDGSGQVLFSDRCFQATLGVAVVFHEYPTAVIDNTDLTITCQNLVITLSGASSIMTTGSLEYSWRTVGGNFVNAGPHTGATVDINGPGTYYLLVTDSETGCSNEVEVVVDRSADIPNAVIAQPEELTCIKRRIMLDATGSDMGSNFVVSWNASNGGVIVNGADTYTPEVEGTGTYTMTLENTDNNCEVNRSVDVTENVTAPDANIAPEGTLDCLTEQIDIAATGSSQGNNITYSWSTSNGMILSSNPDQFRITIGAEGIYTVTVTDLVNGCTNTAQIEIIEEGNTFVSLELEGRNPRCHGETNGYVGVANIVGGNEPFQYTIDGMTYGSNDQFPNLGPGTYVVEVVDASGCTISDTVTIIDPDPFDIELGDNLIVEIGKSVDWEAVFQARVNRNDIASIVWTRDGVIVSTIDTVKATDAGTYTVTVTDVNGCEASDAINLIIKINRRVFIPNAFTPNGDNNNDTFTIFGDDLVEKVNSLEIYNRWGELVWYRENFAPNDPSLGWDGTFQGKDVNPAVFVYKATVEFFDGVQESYYGDFTLIR